MVSRERLMQLELELSDRHRRTRLASVIAFRNDGDGAEFETLFMLEEFIRLDLPGYLQRYGDFLQVSAMSLQGRTTTRSIRHNETFFAVTDTAASDVCDEMARKLCCRAKYETSTEAVKGSGGEDPHEVLLLYSLRWKTPHIASNDALHRRSS